MIALDRMITAEEAKKLMDHYGLPTDCDCNDEDCVKCSHYPTLQERASKKLKEISPDLARTVIALHAQLADAEGRVAALTEALVWCSGSDDFQVGGKARIGWIKLCAPLLATVTPPADTGEGRT